MRDEPQSTETRYPIGEFAELGGVSRRTVRYYVTRELLPAPTGSGRGAYYTAEHLERLVRIRDLQAAGVALSDIARHLDGPGAAPPSPPEPAPVVVGATSDGTRWTRVVVADGVELHVREGVLASGALTTLARLLTRHTLDHLTRTHLTRTHLTRTHLTRTHPRTEDPDEH